MTRRVVLTADERDLLRQKTAELHALTDRLYWGESGAFCWGPGLHVVRAFVWASFLGMDPLASVIQATYGTQAITEVAIAGCRDQVLHLASFRTNLPVREAA